MALLSSSEMAMSVYDCASRANLTFLVELNGPLVRANHGRLKASITSLLQKLKLTQEQKKAKADQTSSSNLLYKFVVRLKYTLSQLYRSLTELITCQGSFVVS